MAASLEASSVTFLNLGMNRIGRAGVEALAPALRAFPVKPLCLEWNMLGDEGVKALAIALGNSSLVVLNLCGNNISDEGVKVLATGIRGSPIKELRLSGNPIGNEGARALAAALQDSDIEGLELYCAGIEAEGWKALLEGVRDTAVTSFGRLDFYDDDDNIGEILKQLKAVLEANEARTFVLQMKVEGDEAEWTFTFRTMAGTVTAVLNWSFERSAADLPEAVFEGMRSSGFQLPNRHLRAHNLRILRPDGQVLDVREDAAPLVSQLGDLKRRRLH